VRGYDTANANVGAWERYQPTLDWVVNAQVNYTRQRDLLSTLGISNSVTQINTTGVGLAPAANQPTYNQYSAAGTVQKNFGTTNELFVILGGSVVDINYDSTTAGVTPSTDGSLPPAPAAAGSGSRRSSTSIPRVRSTSGIIPVAHSTRPGIAWSGASAPITSA
jgi:hypothetical protein